MQRTASILSVYPAAALRVINGANLGDPLSWADDLVHDDIYRLSPVSMLKPLTVRTSATPPFRIADGSELGLPGHSLHLDCCVTFMSGSGDTTECLVLVECDDEGQAHGVYVLPLAEMTPKADYVLVGVCRDSALHRYAQSACTSFTAGTMITMATGAQQPVEDLRPGDRVLTADNGPQPVIWTGRRHLTGARLYAMPHLRPVRIRAAAFGAGRPEDTLVVSPQHRMLVRGRGPRSLWSTPEVLVAAADLVDDRLVTVDMTARSVTYIHSLLEAHQIVWANGLETESFHPAHAAEGSLSPADAASLAALLGDPAGYGDPARRPLDAAEAAILRHEAPVAAA